MPFKKYKSVTTSLAFFLVKNFNSINGQDILSEQEKILSDISGENLSPMELEKLQSLLAETVDIGWVFFFGVGHLGIWASGRLGFWASGRLGTWASGHVGIWAPGHLGTWASWHLGGN